MAVPKRKTSRSRTRSRRAQWKTTAPALVPVDAGGRTVQVPPRLARAVREGRVDVP
ncbi:MULTISPECIES: 50S ribosomal protein L32 [Isoptericola]|uniref:Large ribosomal subunit protein bL32 n=1 Tax=Isoptericola haloaureus TaxID=1542902 RepID=A0ABU7Z7H3_9MICO|nr:50S ribosomal protein L32 [Isoptericola sp. AK164]